jgi:hypothetical protein
MPATTGGGRDTGVHIRGDIIVSNPVDATADEVVQAIGTKLGWRLTNRTDSSAPHDGHQHVGRDVGRGVHGEDGR